ncbi:MAG: response regulator [Reichenbachiella sp.]
MSNQKEALILIVDDQPDNIDTIIAYLSESDFRYKFLQAMNGQLACMIAEKRMPDLIIMDWEMPVMNGYEALLCIKKKPLTADIPVVMATGRSSGSDLERALNAGAADYIRKPIEKQELLARVKTCLSLSRMIKEIKIKNEELKAYDKMVSHDLKGPIGHIVSLSKFLKEDKESILTEESQGFLDQIIKSSQASQELIDGILTFASADQPATLEEAVDLNKIVNDAIEGHLSTISAKDAAVTCQSLPTIEKGISVKIYQLFYNLIGNALKFQKPDEKPVISIYLNDAAEIVVADNGIGFDQKDANDVFKPLKRLETVQRYDGYGIGLGTCQRIVTFHGWSIRAESELGKGSSFIITI